MNELLSLLEKATSEQWRPKSEFMACLRRAAGKVESLSKGWRLENALSVGGCTGSRCVTD